MSASRSRLPLLIAGTLILCGLAAILSWWLNPPTIDYKPLPDFTAAARKPMPPPSPAVKLSMAPPVIANPNAIDPDIQRLADQLANKEQTPMRDLEIINDFVKLYSKAFGSNPIGMNEDITAVLTGHNYTKGVLFPPNSPMIVKGQLVDRWGTPYWFHPNSGTQMEIRSAGEDKNLFTPDDVIINPGPDSIGRVTEAQ